MTSTLPMVGAVRAGRAILGAGRQVVGPLEVRLDGARVAAVAIGGEQGTHDLAGEVIGTAGDLVMPALADAHDHGRGVPTLAFGALDGALETWIPALSLQPRMDPWLLTAFALAKLARSGVASVVHCHNTQDPDALVEECIAAGRAAADVGLRMAVAVPLSDRNRLGYGPDDAVLAHLDDARRTMVTTRWSRRPASIEVQLAAVDAIAEGLAGLPGVSVQYCPVGPQWCSDALLSGVAEASARTGRRVHLHLLETRPQREWADAHHPEGLVAHLDALGILTDRTTVAHGVWLTDAELDVLALRRTVVSVNSTSNLRLRSGLAPLQRMMARGVRVAIGMDGMSVDDDDDALRELQIAHLLHAGIALDGGVAVADVIGASVSVGPVAASGPDSWGVIDTGAPADLLLLDRSAYAADVADGAVEDEASLVLARARAEHVRALVVAGRLVVSDGRVLGVDEPAIAAEVAQRCRAAAGDIAAARPAVAALQDGLVRFYAAGGHCCTEAPVTTGGRA